MPSFYIHVPFCAGKCPYCGFYSTPFNEALAERYTAALERDAAGNRPAFASSVFDTLYFGGGTPTLLPHVLFARIVAVLRRNFAFASSVEFSVETNPRSDRERQFESLLQQDVNRISIGVQSFSDRILQSLGRQHTADQAERTFLLARQAGFTNIAIDLIFGCPGQDDGDWQETLARSIEMQPEHISCYSLTLDEGTVYHREAAAGRLRLPDDDAAAAMYHAAIERLEGAGYRQYEISNFARPGFECRHNGNYWFRKICLGLGPGAASFIGERRFRAVPNVTAYCERLEAGLPAFIDEERLTREDAKLETLMLALRMNRGLSLKQYEQDFGKNERERLAGNARDLAASGFIGRAGDRIFLTRRGMALANSCIEKLAS